MSFSAVSGCIIASTSAILRGFIATTTGTSTSRASRSKTRAASLGFIVSYMVTMALSPTASASARRAAPPSSFSSWERRSLTRLSSLRSALSISCSRVSSSRLRCWSASRRAPSFSRMTRSADSVPGLPGALGVGSAASFGSLPVSLAASFAASLAATEPVTAGSAGS